MFSIIFVAHDPAGALMLEPVIDKFQATGYTVNVVAKGPAIKVWSKYPPLAFDEDVNTVIEKYNPDMVVTGTSYNIYLEQKFWKVANKKNIPSFCVIDAWFNYKHRFLDEEDNIVHCDAIGVIDRSVKKQLVDSDWCDSQIFVTGQPYLEMQVNKVKKLRASKKNSKLQKLAWFSEPIWPDTLPSEYPGYSQYEVADLFIDSLNGVDNIEVLIKPHPLESPTDWINWLSKKDIPEYLNVYINNNDIKKILADADGVIGISTMVLVEAVLLDIPCLSLQPNRKLIVNPILEKLQSINILVEKEKVNDGVKNFIKNLHNSRKFNDEITKVTDSATDRLFEAIENQLKECVTNKNESDIL